MVRPFLVTHQGAHEVHFPRMEPILAAEGLTQGDPAAPVYAQLVYGGICQRVRDELDPKLLASFFDDTFIVDDFDLALKGVLKLKQLFHEVGLEVCLDKSSVYSTTPLTEEQLGELAEHGIRDAGEGILLLGTPIGSDSFIRQYLASETSSVMDILGDIQTAVDVGHLNDRLATHQGIYHLLRDCGNQLLRHLLRTVDPRLTCEAFRQLDTRTLGVAMHLFEIDQPQLTEVVKTRLLLPGTLSGLALTPYCLAAVPAFLGCMMSVGRRLAIPVTNHKGSSQDLIRHFIASKTSCRRRTSLHLNSFSPTP